MRILPISNTNIRYNKTYTYKPLFKAKPDFQSYNSTVSCYFRRGSVVLSCAKDYEKIEQLFSKIFKSDTSNPRKMLIIGIGKSQEPLSYLASIKGIIKDRTLKHSVDLYSVDLQSKPNHLELKDNAFCDLFDYQSFPRYAKSGFIKDSTRNWLENNEKREFSNPLEQIVSAIFSIGDKWKELKDKGYSLGTVLKMAEEERKQGSLRWRVNDEIFNFLEETYNNPQKSKWECGIQDVISEYPSKKFDVISANNVLPYILYEPQIEHTVKHIVRILKPNGYLITDPYNFPYHIKEINKYPYMKKIDLGIYQKTAAK